MTYFDVTERRQNKLQWEMSALLVEHQLLEETYWPEGARWLVGQEDTNHMRFEVVAGIFGSLIVHGDIDVVRFGHYSDHPDAWNRLRWMAFCNDLGYYVAQKASIGLGRFGAAVVYDEGVARAEIHRDWEAARNALPPRLEQARVLEEALEYHTENEYDLRDFLSAAGTGDLDYGRCVAPSVVLAHRALNKTACLLLEKYGESGPPLERT